MDIEYKWWASADQERYTIGPCDTREQVLAEAEENDLGLRQDEEGHWSRLTFHIQEAALLPVDLSRHFDADSAWERLDENVSENHGDPEGGDSLLESVSDEVFKDFSSSIEAAIRDWQARNKIVVTPWIFSATRNGEHVDMRVPLPLK